MMQSNPLDNIELLTDIGDSFEIIVTGYSMLPLLGKSRDRIVIRRTSANDDIMHRIAMFRSANGKLVTHRVVAIDDDIVTLQGDGNPIQRERCRRHDIIGVVDRVIRESGKSISCTGWWWRTRERLWLWQPRIVRRYVLAIMRRWLERRKR